MVIACWGRRSTIHLILSVSLGPLKRTSSAQTGDVHFSWTENYQPEVNSVGCSAGRVAQLDLKEVRDSREPFSQKESKHSCLSDSYSSTLSVGVMLCTFIGNLKAVLDLP